MKKLTFNANFLAAMLCVAMLLGLAAQADAQPRKKFSRAGRPASLDQDLDTIIPPWDPKQDPKMNRRVLAILIGLLLPASQNLAAPSETIGSDDPALIVFDVKNPNVRRIFPLTNPVFADSSVRFVGFANVDKDTGGNSDDKEAIFEVREKGINTAREAARIAVVSHKTGLVMSFEQYDLVGLRNYDGSRDGFLDMLLYNRTEGQLEVWGN